MRRKIGTLCGTTIYFTEAERPKGKTLREVGLGESVRFYDPSQTYHENNPTPPMVRIEDDKGTSMWFNPTTNRCGYAMSSGADWYAESSFVDNKLVGTLNKQITMLKPGEAFEHGGQIYWMGEDERIGSFCTGSGRVFNERAIVRVVGTVEFVREA